jgi:phage terminase large subunit-like protein
MAGRALGKTRAGAEWVPDAVKRTLLRPPIPRTGCALLVEGGDCH